MALIDTYTQYGTRFTVYWEETTPCTCGRLCCQGPYVRVDSDYGTGNIQGMMHISAIRRYVASGSWVAAAPSDLLVPSWL